MTYTTWMPLLSRQKKGACVGRAGKIKGTKISLVVDNDGLPEVLHIEKASRHDRHATGTIVREIPKNSYLAADRGYDCKRFRRHLRHLKLKPVIPKRQFKTKPKVRVPKPTLFSQRWKIERAFAWLGKYRKLNVRYDYKAENYEALWLLGCSRLLIQKLIG